VLTARKHHWLHTTDPFDRRDQRCHFDSLRAGTCDEKDLRPRLTAPAKNATQDLYVSGPLKTARVMVKDEDVCLHCGLCAERCPTGAWDMKKYLIDMTHANDQCRVAARSAA